MVCALLTSARSSPDLHEVLLMSDVCCSCLPPSVFTGSIQIFGRPNTRRHVGGKRLALRFRCCGRLVVAWLPKRQTAHCTGTNRPGWTGLEADGGGLRAHGCTRACHHHADGYWFHAAVPLPTTCQAGSSAHASPLTRVLPATLHLCQATQIVRGCEAIW